MILEDRFVHSNVAANNQTTCPRRPSHVRPLEVHISLESTISNLQSDDVACQLPMLLLPTQPDLRPEARYGNHICAPALHSRESAYSLQEKEIIDCEVLPSSGSAGTATLWDGYRKELHSLLTNAKYREAVVLGEAIWRELPGSAKLSDIAILITQAHAGLLYARALIYTAHTFQWLPILESIISKLETVAWSPELLDTFGLVGPWDQRIRLVLGRAHNDLGYAYWMNLGRPSPALRELQSAEQNFRLGNLPEELANTYDNMGRVHIMLGNYALAAGMIEKGLSIRRILGNDYRIALSLNSRAMAHLESGELWKAKRRSEEAIGIFRQLNSPRGIGLATITLGRVMCYLGERLDTYSEPSEQVSCLLKSKEYLLQAVDIFEHEVDEPIRLVHALIELVHIYQVMAVLGATSGRRAEQMAELRRKARRITQERCFSLPETYRVCPLGD